MKEIIPENKGISNPSQTIAKSCDLILDPGQTKKFDHILSRTLDLPSAPATDPVKGLPELSATITAQMSKHAPDNAPALVRISEAIDLLEAYASGLIHPDNSLKRSYDLLDQILNHTREINTDLDKDQDDNPLFKEILTHLSTVAQLEKIKINRGDYA
ncbi:MAG: hypothetical protein HUK40_21160 [Desulfobacter sp.]|nr:hypothetical protein [Desulfobacter sp.]